mmetsp:Transcript_120662/g.180221  ORF Transcript_120662/g.180221 Transcript_120662/m.180221 type:complete len:398 (+) Transcript_120662:222-1415(+)
MSVQQNASGGPGGMGGGVNGGGGDFNGMQGQGGQQMGQMDGQGGGGLQQGGGQDGNNPLLAQQQALMAMAGGAPGGGFDAGASREALMNLLTRQGFGGGAAGMGGGMGAGMGGGMGGMAGMGGMGGFQGQLGGQGGFGGLGGEQGGGSGPENAGMMNALGGGQGGFPGFNAGLMGGMAGMGGMGGMAGMGGMGGMAGMAGMGGMGGMPGMGGGFGAAGMKRPHLHDLKLSLEELYTGCTKKMKITRKSTTLRREPEKVFELQIKPGWKAGTKLTFPSEGDEYGNTGQAQDIVFVVREKPHEHFQRQGHDLVFKAKVPLVDALTGFKVDVPMLDSRTLRVNVQDVVKPSYTKIVRGEGMPLAKEPGSKGDLVITFDVIWPSRLDDSTKQQLKAILPAR